VHGERPAKAGSTSAGSASAGSAGAGTAGAGTAGAGTAGAGTAGAGTAGAGHRHPGEPGAIVRSLAWLPYLIVLAVAAAGLFIAWQGSRYAGRGAGLVGCALLAGALARLVLPPRYAAPLSSRGRAADVLAFAVFGVSVLVVAITLP
jgi:Protein of unknown function (DUF3017)